MFYATARTPAGQVAYLAGPFRTHGAALAAVFPATRLARQYAPFAMFDAAFGTARVKTPELRKRIGPGKLNDKLAALPKDVLP